MIEYIAGTGHYNEVLARVANVKQSLWIGTADIKDLHLIQPFHHLFDHMNFAITDFIYVRQFETEINIEIKKEL